MAILRSDDGISRRDFINGMLVATGGAMASGLFPPGAEACVDIGKDVCDGSIGLDPRALRGGNLPTAFKVAHWLRDERLTFTANSVKVKAGGLRHREGQLPHPGRRRHLRRDRRRQRHVRPGRRLLHHPPPAGHAASSSWT